VAHGDAPVDGDLTLVRLLLAVMSRKRVDFPAPLGADEPDLLAPVDDRRRLDEEDLVAVLHGDGVEADQGVAFYTRRRAGTSVPGEVPGEDPAGG